MQGEGLGEHQHQLRPPTCLALTTYLPRDLMAAVGPTGRSCQFPAGTFSALPKGFFFFFHLQKMMERVKSPAFFLGALFLSIPSLPAAAAQLDLLEAEGSSLLVGTPQGEARQAAASTQHLFWLPQHLHGAAPLPLLLPGVLASHHRAALLQHAAL